MNNMKINSKAREIIENNPISLATVKNNKPYVIGVAYCMVVDDDKILITDNFMISTVKNILSNNNVAIVVWNKKMETDNSPIWHKHCYFYSICNPFLFPNHPKYICCTRSNAAGNTARNPLFQTIND